MMASRRTAVSTLRAGLSSMLTTQTRRHHFKVQGEGSEQSVQHLGPHTEEQSGNLGMTRNFANRHLAQVHGDTPTGGNQSLIAQMMASLREQGVGIQGGNPRPRFSTTVLAGSGFVPPLDNQVSTSSPGVHGIVTTDRKNNFMPSVNSTAEVGRNKNGQINHLESAN